MPQLNLSASELVTDYGDYYINNGQNEGMIHTLLRESFKTRDEFKVIETEDTLLRAVSTKFDSVIQAFQKQWTPKGGITFKTSDIRLFNIKMDVEFYPDDIKNDWRGFLTDNNLNRTEWPFVRWVVEKYLVGQIVEDLEKQWVYSGVYVAPTAGTAGASNAAADGIKKIINSKITAGTIVPIATGAPNTTPATWTGQLETFLEGIPELYRSEEHRIRMSNELARRHKRGNRAKYNNNWEVVGREEMESFIDFPNASVVGLPSHTGANKIWTTPKGNAIMAFKGGSNANVVRLENVDRLVKAYTDFYVGIGFIMDELVWTNDQDLV